MRLSPRTVYLILAGATGFCLMNSFATAAVYAVTVVGLNPLQLVLVGTVLEAVVLVAEVPTGVVADAYSRRLSVIIGILLIGAGFVVWGAFAIFETVLLAQVLWGIGYTFTSGAEQAWVADELGDAEPVGPVYLRGAQLNQAGSFLGVFTGVGLAALFNLHVPFIVSGVLFAALAVFLIVFMRERGFRPDRSAGAGSLRLMAGTLRAGIGAIRLKPVLLTILLAGAIYGAASEGMDRLWVAHLLEQTSLPEIGGLDPIVWFAVIQSVGMLLGIGVTEVVSRRSDLSVGDGPAKALAVLTSLLIAAMVVFAFASVFWVAIAAFWASSALRRAHDPVFLAWINQSLSPSIRATVLSMQGQADALGQVAGGPMIGALATVRSITTALVASAFVLIPSLGLYLRTARGVRGDSEEVPAAGPTSKPPAGVP